MILDDLLRNKQIVLNTEDDVKLLYKTFKHLPDRPSWVDYIGHIIKENRFTELDDMPWYIKYVERLKKSVPSVKPSSNEVCKELTVYEFIHYYNERSKDLGVLSG